MSENGKETEVKLTRNNGKFVKGNTEGNRFSSENQPTPEQKRMGWVKREEMRDAIAKMITEEDIKKIISKGTIKELIELIKAILPPEKQTQEFLGSLGIEKVFVTPEEMNKVDNHIDNVINDGLELSVNR